MDQVVVGRVLGGVQGLRGLGSPGGPRTLRLDWKPTHTQKHCCTWMGGFVVVVLCGIFRFLIAQ